MTYIPNFLGDGQLPGETTPPQHIEGALGGATTRVKSSSLASDEETLQEIRDNLRDSDPETKRLRQSQEVGRNYYLGNQFRDVPWPVVNDVMENRIFMSVGTLVPMVTSQAGDPDIRCLLEMEGQEKSVQNYIDTLTSMLLYDYNVTLNLKQQIRRIITHWFQCKIGVGKFRRDPMTGKTVFEDIDPRNIVVPTKNSAQGWVAEYREDTIADLLVMFPKSKEKIEKKYGNPGSKLGVSILGTKMGYWEYHRDTFVAWKMDDILLDKIPNPHWDWEGVDKIVGEQPVPLPDGTIINEPIMEKFFYNILERPTNPYIFFNFFNHDGLLYDDTSYIEQVRSAQDNLNHRKQQISARADDSGILIATGDAISEDEFSKYDSATSAGTTFWMPSGDARAAFHRLPPGEVSQGMILDLNDTRQIMDDLFGTQPVTRSQVSSSTPQSGIGQQIAKQGDLNRVVPIAEAVEDFLQKVYMFDLQMHMLNTDTDYIVPAPNISSTSDYRNSVFNRDKVPFVKVKRILVIDGKEKEEEYMTPVPITLTVRRSSTLPKDPASKYNEMLTLNQAGLSEPLSLYEDMGYADPVSRYERLIKFKTNPVLLLPPDQQKDFINEQTLFAQEQATAAQELMMLSGGPPMPEEVTEPGASAPPAGTLPPTEPAPPNGGM